MSDPSGSVGKPTKEWLAKLDDLIDDYGVACCADEDRIGYWTMLDEIRKARQALTDFINGEDT